MRKCPFEGKTCTQVPSWRPKQIHWTHKSDLSRVKTRAKVASQEPNTLLHPLGSLNIRQSAYLENKTHA